MICQASSLTSHAWPCRSRTISTQYVLLYRRYASLTDLVAIKQNMDAEQKELFVIDSAIFTVMLVLSVLGALIASTIIFAILLTVERKARAKEMRAAKARRLRWSVDDSEVELGEPIIPSCIKPSFEPTYRMGAVSGRYHLFLSHVWGSECSEILTPQLHA